MPFELHHLLLIATIAFAAYVLLALSGFGSMGACATGSLCAAWIAGKPVPAFATALAPARRQDTALMAELAGLAKGTL